MNSTGNKSVQITRTETTEITLTEEQAAEALRHACAAPEDAKVKFECGYDMLREVTIKWTRTTAEGE